MTAMGGGKRKDLRNLNNKIYLFKDGKLVKWFENSVTAKKKIKLSASLIRHYSRFEKYHNGFILSFRNNANQFFNWAEWGAGDDASIIF